MLGHYWNKFEGEVNSEERNSDEPPVNPYAAPNVASDTSEEDTAAKSNSIHLEQAGCFYVFMFLMASASLFAAWLFYNPFAPPTGPYRGPAWTFSLVFVFAAAALIGVGSIVFYNALRKKRT